MRRTGTDQHRAAIWVGGALAVVFALVGCGGSTESTDAQPNPSAVTGGSAATAAATSAGDGDSTAAPDVDLGGAELNTAIVVVGDERFEFADVRCDIFTARYIQAGNYGVYPEVIIVLPPEGWESQGDVFSPPSIKVTVGDANDSTVWLAGEANAVFLPPNLEGLSRIDSYAVPDGRPVRATGTATFINVGITALDPEQTTGTFEVTCP